MYTGQSGPVAGGLALTGLALPFGWYFVAAIALIVVGYLLVRHAVRARDRRRSLGRA